MRVLLLNQAFYPDIVSSAQHAADLARSFVQNGHEVTVVCSRRAYDNPARRFAETEEWHGIRVLRIPCTGFGKANKVGRILDFCTFLVACLMRLVVLGRFDVVVAMTSPPLLSFIAALFTRLRGYKLVLWILDMNPDEAIAAGWLKEESVAGRFLRALQVYSLRQASQIVVLDRFMRERIAARGISDGHIAVIPPWSHDESVSYDHDGRERFRVANGLAGRFVVMYSGNHSPCHPLDTLLEAARQLATHSDIAFCFIGGGSEFKKVKDFAACHSLTNIVCLPYQPREKLRESLSAADLHSVVMGDPFVGTVHPCKIYNILALGVPFLYLGPAQSHIEDLISADGLQNACYSVRHGDVRLMVTNILTAARTAKNQDSTLVESSVQFSAGILAPRMVKLCESVGASSPVSLISYPLVARKSEGADAERL